MAAGTGIEWTEATWNPVTGCTKVSAGCKNCYAERMAKRLQAMGQPNYAQGFAPVVHPRMLDLPLAWKRPRTIFVNSMSDLLHEDVPVEFIRQAVDVMRRAHWHRFQVLTKRAERLRTLDGEIRWPGNVWVGVSVENRATLGRIEELRRVRAAVRFLSLEPLLEDLGRLPLDGVDWVIAGGESGPGARPMEAEWVRGVRDQCAAAGVAFFFKQWGGSRKKAAGRTLDGLVWAAMPEECGMIA